ncbi:cytokine receptor-like factor 2 [Octodon degus]|uniref:Cytokine receptor-like factor 2 n=1 Tax=Octodon degus TaxID=10160 RepID=A0A6P6DRP5_OCTDE|nr:cytokine receptor-like factor 2 [Octodon degus]
MGPRVQPWVAAAILLLLGDPADAGDPEAGEAVQVQIIYFNFETVQVTWNDTGTNLSFSYKAALSQSTNRSINRSIDRSSAVADVCNVTFEGLDVERCHLFRARVKADEASYGPDIPPSDWTQVAHWRGAAPQASCLQPLDHLWSRWTRFLLVCSLVSLLAVGLLVVGLWKAQRVKRLLMPTVPDPSYSFSGLFEQHQGDFQEWIADTQHVAPWRKAPAGEQEPAAEQTLEVQLCGVDTRLPAAPSLRQEEAPAGSPRPPPREPQADSLVSLGGFAFVVTDSAYMKL